jgi:hypothetical protein
MNWIRNAVLQRYKRIGCVFPFLSLALVSYLFPATSAAQMFSVQSTPRSASEEFSYFSFGIDPSELRFKGVSGNDPRFDFDSPLYRVQFDAQNVHIRAGFGSGLGSYDGSLFTVGGSLLPLFPVYQSRWLSLYGRAGFETDFYRIRPGNAGRELIWSTGSAGAGMQLSVRAGSSVRINAGVTRTIGFLTRDYGIEGGVTRSLQVPVVIHIRNLLGQRGITLGMNLHRVDFDNESEGYRYDMLGRQFFIGVNF